MFNLKKIFIGPPLSTARLAEERLGKAKALPIFSSDALSSVAYATEEILLVLITAGVTALSYSIPISLAIIILLAILILSYRQTIYSYPSGGGAYIVANDNLGTIPGLVAGWSLMIDYTLTVAVSITAGVAAITSALPSLLPYNVELCLFAIAFLAIMNLRGIRESATVFAYPTYLFILSVCILTLTGLFKYFVLGYQPPSHVIHQGFAAGQAITLFLILRAFASGCTALTGVEAISNGVKAFHEPAPRNASITLIWMGIILMSLFTGITTLANLYHVTPSHTQTVVSQIAEQVFGRNILYYILQGSTALILILAANTSYAGFPLLASLIAHDGYLPRVLSSRGDRLVFSYGIIFLSMLAGFLIVIFRGSTHALIPLYAVGVFLSFTLSQSGMVVHWLKAKAENPKWLHNALINGVGALITCIALIVIAATKFIQGAWIILILIPSMVKLSMGIKKHYQEIAHQLSLEGVRIQDIKRQKKNIVIVPVAGLTRIVINTLEYAKTLSGDVRAVHISIDEEHTKKTQEKWEKYKLSSQLIVIPSPYRNIIDPLLRYIDQVEKESGPDEIITVLIPEFVTKKWWYNFLHNQTAFVLAASLIFRKDVIVANVPYHLNA